MHPIKTIYNFIVSIQILALILFIFYLIENNFDIVIPINIGYTLSLPSPLPDIPIEFNYDFHFNYATIFGLVFVLFLVYLVSSITAVGSGLTDSGTLTIKQLLSFISKFLILQLPIVFLMSKSDVLGQYIVIIDLFILIIYVLNLLIDTGEEKNAI